MRRSRLALAVPPLIGLGLLAAAGLTAACDSNAEAAVIDPGDGGSYQPSIQPANFVDRITNPYLPLTPGSRWVYQSTDGKERTEVTVLSETRMILGIKATIVRDTVSEDGEVVEDTYDWFAQDKDGNVWYLGEQSQDYEAGKLVSTEGSWEAGVNGALPGIVMLASPAAGRSYRQEFDKGEAEDLARVERTGTTQSVRGTRYEKVVVIREWNPLEPKNIEEKYYAPGIGMILETKVRGGKGRAELISFTPGK